MSPGTVVPIILVAATTEGCFSMSTITAATERQFLATVVPCIRDLRRLAIFLTRNSADADDLVQDTLFRAVRKLHLWQPGTNMMAWLVVMMRRLYLSHFIDSRHNRAKTIPIDDWDASTPATQMQTLEVMEVAARWQNLSKDHREILDMVAVWGASYEEAAEQLRIPMGTIRSRLARARTRLRHDTGAPRRAAFRPDVQLRSPGPRRPPDPSIGTG
ncbi:RNA polymerase sigma factor [Inquilinus sp. OTU3971]|uniref:RNA polymerase sigma factor n=1 Tax=Inquilinus sp. OTU3971 TaxID=3043855 RepID=UPI00313C0312